MLVLSLALLSALALGFYDVAKKRALLEEEAMPTLVASSLFGAGLALLVLAFRYVTVGAVAGTAFSLQNFAYVSVKSALVSTSWILNFVAQKHLPLSLAAPLRATSPIVTLFLSVLVLGERLDGLEWCGVALIVISYLSLSSAAKLENITLASNRYVALLTAGTLLASLSGLYDKHLLGSLKLHSLDVQILFSLENACFLSAVFWFQNRGSARVARPARPLPWKRGVFLIALFLFLADLAYFRALSYEGARVAIVSATRRTSLVVAFIASGFLLREKYLKEKAWSVALALTGVLLLLYSH
jgi:transporter family protein